MNRNGLELSLSRITRRGLWYCFISSGEQEVVGSVREKTPGGDHGKDASACSFPLCKLCVALAYSDPFDAKGGSVLLTTIRVPADVMRPDAAPLFVRVAKVSDGCSVLPEERIIKSLILGDL